MENSTILERSMNDPETAMANLGDLFSLLKQTDSPEFELAVEAFENCGVPSDSVLSILLTHQTSGTGEQSYWSSTLIGRWLEEHPSGKNDSMRQQVIHTLAESLKRESQALPATERTIWALALAKPLPESVRQLLESRRAGASERLGRLIEAAMN